MLEELGPGIAIVGTAHVSQRSVDAVEAAIRERRPEKVLVELDEKRFEALKDPEAWQQTDIVQVIRQKKQHLFLLQLYLAAFQARMGRDTGVSPGGEMLRAIQVADELGAQVVLIDRDVAVTLKRGFGSMGFWSRLKLFWNVWLDLLTPSFAEEGPVDVDSLLETDAITQMTEDFSRFAPKVKEALIDERDAYMASHIREQAAAGSVVAVVGAGHLAGIKRHLASPAEIPDRDELDVPPARRLTVGKVVAYAIPLFIVGVFVYLGVTGRYADLAHIALWWVVINGGLSALGALIARGHPFSILTAFAAAPITSLNPALAAGWFAGLVEAMVRTPTVADFQAIKEVDTMREFARNGVVRVVLVTALANLGSVIGTWIAGVEVVRTLTGGT